MMLGGWRLKNIHLVETILGIMAVDDQGNVIEKELFEKNSEEIAEKIYKLQQGEIIPELQQIAQKVKNVEEIVVEDESLAKVLREMYQAKITVEKPSPIAQQIRAQVPDLAQKYNYAKSLQEYIQLTHQIATYLTRRKIRTAAEKRDQLIAQAIETTIMLLLNFPLPCQVLWNYKRHVLKYKIGKYRELRAPKVDGYSGS